MFLPLPEYVQSIFIARCLKLGIMQVAILGVKFIHKMLEAWQIVILRIESFQ